MGILSQDPSGFLVPAALVAVGAVAGAWLRWLAGVWLSPVLDHPVLSTLLVNLVGGLLMGGFLAWTNLEPDLASGWRLVLVTGFLGSLTTFSAFTGEVFTLVQQGRLLAALLVAGLHGFGSLTAAASGFYLIDFVAKLTRFS